MEEIKKGRVGAIILAAGRGSRMKSRIQKQFMLLDGKPLLCYCLEVFEQSPVDDVILVTGQGEEEYCRQEIVEGYQFQKIRQVVTGGKERYHSVYEGLKAMTELCGYGSEDYVLIQDGARPFVDEAMIVRVTEAARAFGASVAGMPSKDTVKLSDNLGFARMTPERSTVWMIQTPQAFSFSLIYEAYKKLMSRKEYQSGITDDAMVVETMTDCKVRLVEGSYRNMKVTTPEDMTIAAALLAEKKEEFLQ